MSSNNYYAVLETPTRAVRQRNRRSSREASASTPTPSETQPLPNPDWTTAAAGSFPASASCGRVQPLSARVAELWTWGGPTEQWWTRMAMHSIFGSRTSSAVAEAEDDITIRTHKSESPRALGLASTTTGTQPQTPSPIFQQTEPSWTPFTVPYPEWATQKLPAPASSKGMQRIPAHQKPIGAEGAQRSLKNVAHGPGSATTPIESLSSIDTPVSVSRTDGMLPLPSPASDATAVQTLPSPETSAADGDAQNTGMGASHAAEPPEISAPASSAGKYSTPIRKTSKHGKGAQDIVTDAAHDVGPSITPAPSHAANVVSAQTPVLAASPSPSGITTNAESSQTATPTPPPKYQRYVPPYRRKQEEDAEEQQAQQPSEAQDQYPTEHASDLGQPEQEEYHDCQADTENLPEDRSSGVRLQDDGSKDVHACWCKDVGFYMHNEYAFLLIMLWLLSTLALIFSVWRHRLGNVPYFTTLKVIAALCIRQSSNSVQVPAFRILTAFIAELVILLVLLPILPLR